MSEEADKLARCDRLERELADARRILRECKMAMLGYPQDARAYTPKQLLAAIRECIREF